MITLPTIPETTNVRVLAQWQTERLTNRTTTALTLSNVIDPNAVLLFKNGSLLDPTTYTVAMNTITLGSTPVTTDVFVCFYHFTRNPA